MSMRKCPDYNCQDSAKTHYDDNEQQSAPACAQSIIAEKDPPWAMLCRLFDRRCLIGGIQRKFVLHGCVLAPPLYAAAIRRVPG
jgi:hypothetical protein